MNKELDRLRIAHLMKIGIAAALMVLAGDMLLGWGVHDAAKSGMEGFLSAYKTRVSIENKTTYIRIHNADNQDNVSRKKVGQKLVTRQNEKNPGSR